jgi:hypothetical protein
MHFPAYRARNRFQSLLTGISIGATATPSKVEKLHHRPPERLRVPGLIRLSRCTVRSAELCGFFELLEPECQPVAIGTDPQTSWPVDQRSGDPLEAEF